MKILALSLLLAVLCTRTDPDRNMSGAEGAAAGKSVVAFLQAYQVQHFRGLPDTNQARSLAPRLSPRLNGLLEDALREQQKYKVRLPSDKPPMVDGDIFSSLFEGATRGEVEAVTESADTATVRIKYIYTDPATGKTIQSWNDRFLLVRSGQNWLIDDVEYQGSWDFAVCGRLSAALIETASLGQ
jgi:hypothetical protein